MHRLALAAVSLGLAVALLPTPAAAATPSTPTTLYFHVFDTLTAFPINTQQPKSSFFEVGGTSFPTIASQGFTFNSIRGFGTPGPVEYNYIEAGRPRFHFEHGIADAVQLDKDKGATAYLYLDVRDFLGLHNAPDVLPSFTFHVAMRAGNDLASDQILDTGQLLLQGSLTAHVANLRACAPDPQTLDPMQCQDTNSAIANTDVNGVPVLIPDAAGVVEFPITLDMPASAIPKSSYNVKVEWWQNPTGDASQDRQFAEGYMRLVSDHDHHPRIELAVTNPLAFTFVHPEVAAGILLIHTGINSPWGTYDVDVANMTATVTGPSAPQKLIRVTSQNAHVHNLHDKPVEVTWLWRFREEGAKLGDYAITVKANDIQKNATVTQTAGFTIAEDRAFGVDESGHEVASTFTDNAKASPAAGMLVAGVLAACAIVARRRGGAA